MGLFDFEDVDDILEEGYVQESENVYLSNSEKAICLVSKILSISHGSYYKMKAIRQIDYMIDVDFLGSFRQIQLNNEAQLQVKLAHLSDKLLEQKKYQVLRDKSVIGIGGKFSTGKSKFINSILKTEEELLPEDQNPTTSIPTYIVYGTNEEINAYTTDNNQVSLDVESLQALTHKFYEKYKLGFSSFINSLIIMEPDMPYRNLVFLDTPGYSKADSFAGGKSQKNVTEENKAYEQLKNVDFLIWLVDIENGVLSETDITFISKLGIETPILIVVNKSDKKIDDEIAEIVEHIKNTAYDAGINCFAVTAYSSRKGEEWGNQGKIKAFFANAQKKKTNKEDILAQISQIEQEVSREIDIKIDEKVSERNKLNNVIFNSDDIMEIKTLIDIYGETMESIRDMCRCRSKYFRNVKKLEKSLDKHFERKKS